MWSFVDYFKSKLKVVTAISDLAKALIMDIGSWIISEVDFGP